MALKNMRTDAKSGARKAPKSPQLPVDNDEADDDAGDFADIASRTVSRGDSAAVVARHLAEKAKARRQRDEWKQLYLDLRAEVPEGSIVLVGKEAEAIEALQERNVDLSKLNSLVETLENTNATLTAENLEFKSRGMYSEFAKSSGYNEDAIAGVVKGEKLHAELGDITVDTVDGTGKKTGSTTKKTLKVRKAADPKAPLVPFDDYVDANVKWQWPALKTKPATQTATGTQQPPAPQSFVATESGPSSSATGTNPITQFRQQRDQARAKQVSPLSFGAGRQNLPQGGRSGVPTK